MDRQGRGAAHSGVKAQSPCRPARRLSARREDRVHREIRRQADAMWGLYARTGMPAAGGRFPALFGLYDGVLAALLASRASRFPSSVSYAGKRYPIETTSFGRLRVLEPETRRLLVVGGIGDVW